MSPDDYDAWHRTSRGARIGDTEFSLLGGLLAPRRGESLLDVGCGTGYFSRRFAGAALAVTGIDADAGMLEFALGLLNRHSLLYLQKGGAGAYRGARWHTDGEVRELLAPAAAQPTPGAAGSPAGWR